MPDNKNNSSDEKSSQEKTNEQSINNKKQQGDKNEVQPSGGLTKEDLPDATNESTGVIGSGQRQDSN